MSQQRRTDQKRLQGCLTVIRKRQKFSKAIETPHPPLKPCLLFTCSKNINTHAQQCLQ